MKKYHITNKKIKIDNNWIQISSIDDISVSDINNSLFTLSFDADDEYLYHIEKIIDNGGKFEGKRKYSKRCFYHANRNTQLAINKTQMIANESKIMEFKPPQKLMTDRLSAGQLVHSNICQVIEQTKLISGDYVEIGVFRGSCAATALNYMNMANIKRKAYFLDTYDGFNYEASKKSADVMWNETHKVANTPEEHIKQLSSDFSKNFPNNDYKFVKSNICKDSLPREVTSIAVANIDVDLYDATLSALIKVDPLMRVGGIIICEDPTSTPACIGAFAAMENFLKTKARSHYMKINAIGQYFLIKIK